MTAALCSSTRLLARPPMLLMLLAVLHPSTAAVSKHTKQEEGAMHWYNLGRQDIEEALQRPTITGVAKNVILLLGDGMGVSTVTAGRIYKGQQKGQPGEEGYLEFDRLPNIALLKTYNVDKQVADSAASATAYLSGVKGNFYTMGLTAAVTKSDCEASLEPRNRASSILSWAQQQGKETGIVTTTRVTHATPAAAYAASADRDWECDAKMKEEEGALLCKDIARQLIEDQPGRSLKVVLGGGRQPLGAQSPNSTSWSCRREDGRNLVDEWYQQHHSEGSTAAYVTSTSELEDVDLDNTDYIMGLFADSHLDYEVDRDNGPSGQPSLSQMTATAITRLSRAEKGYVLLVEGGRIDHGLHDGKPQLALDEVVSFDAAVQTALSMVDLQDTLVVVTADHSHGLTINGYAERGHDILGSTLYEDGVTDGMEYTTLMFTTGPGYKYHWDGEKVSRENVTGLDTHARDFMFQSAVPTKVGWASHGGEDVAVYAAGPWAHLFHRVHEQSYVAHVIAYSAAIGPFASDSERPVPRWVAAGRPAAAASAATSAAAGQLKIAPCVTLLCIMAARQSYLSLLF